MKNFKMIFVLLCLNICLATSCADYLDIIPDSLTTVDDAFSSRSNAEKFWQTCYGYLPSVVRPFHDPNWIASKGDEFWYHPHDDNYPYNKGDGGDIHGLRVFYGFQRTSDPYLNYWDGGLAGIPLFRAIRECNIFLENVEEKDIVPDLSDFEREWWIGEVKFLKAFYHFYLMKYYGPIPIIRRNPDMNASPEELRVYREPIDEVVNYIVELLDEAAGHLSNADINVRYNSWEWGGRVTTAIAKAVKAQVLVWGASPLFNGNSFYTGFKDSRGVQLIPVGDPVGTPDISKWKRAADACKEAILAAENGNGAAHSLYKTYRGTESSASAATKLKYVLRYAVTEPFNQEIVWPSTHPTTGFGGWGTGMEAGLWSMNLERESVPSFEVIGGRTHNGSMGTTLKMAELFYTDKGLPIEEDDDWQRRIGGLSNRYDTKQAEGDAYHQHYIKQGITTAQLNFFREPRFYAYVGFDGGIWEGLGKPEAESYVVNKSAPNMTYNIPTGYYMKKVVHPESAFSQTGNYYTFNSKPYTFPYIRLSDLYLLYAEALNESVEADGAVPEDVYTYVDAVRTRAGLLGVKATWSQAASKDRNKPNSKDGMRQIIRRERAVELCFEGKRADDMRRWRIAHEEFNDPIRGWSGIAPNNNPALLTNANYYLVMDHYVRSSGFGLKDYLFPIKADNINVNNNLVQNPGW
jgi:hypothetical protein